MQIIVDIPDEMAAQVEAQLAAEALPRGLTLQSYIVEKLVGSRSIEPVQPRSVGEAIESIRALRKENHLDGLKIKDLIDEGRKF